MAFRQVSKRFSKFAAAIAAIKDAKEENGILKLPYPLFGDGELGDRILVRESYLMLWNKLQQAHEEEGCTKLVVTGQPGVGKTFWLIWLLIRWASCVYHRLPESLTAKSFYHADACSELKALLVWKQALPSTGCAALP